MNLLDFSWDWVTIANLFIGLAGVVFAGLALYVAKESDSRLKFIVVPIGIIGSVILVSMAVLAMVAPSEGPGWNKVPESIDKIVRYADRFVVAFENFVNYFAGQQQEPGGLAGLPEGTPTETPSPTRRIAANPTRIAVNPTASPATPRPTIDLNPGPNQYEPPSQQTNIDPKVGNKQQAEKQPEGNLVTCVPPNPPNYAWIWLYRLDENNQWYRIDKGIGSINANGYLKVDGIAVNTSRFQNRGEPYKIEKVVNNEVVATIGDFQNGQSEFRIFPDTDNQTNWPCP